MISEHAILSYFAQAGKRGWALMRRGSLATGWHAVYQGQLTDYDVFVDVDEQWVYMQCPLLRANALPKCIPALYEYLLRANDRMFLAKFTLFRAQDIEPPADWIALTAECPIDLFDASMFRLMTEAIATYAEQYDREIAAIGLDPEVASLVKMAEAPR